METIKIGEVLCVLKRSSRHSIGFKVGADAVPIIFAPVRVTTDRVVKICLPYENRLAQMAAKQRELNKQRDEFVLSYGDSVRVLGTTRVLREGHGRPVGYDSESLYIPDGLDTDGIRAATVKAYKLLAGEYLSERVTHIAKIMGVKAPPLKINSAKTHWASCSKVPSLNFSWYCIMADPKALDYIIIHELCHLKYFNHSAQFWCEVEKYCPGCKSHKSYLKGLWQNIKTEKWD